MQRQPDREFSKMALHEVYTTLRGRHPDLPRCGARFACRQAAAARQRQVQEQLVFELFGIRDLVRQQLRQRAYGKDVPKRLRGQDETLLYSIPIRCLL